MRHLSRVFVYLATFGLARGSLFFAPIVLANLLAPVDYGRLELAQAVGSIAAIVLAMGTSAAVPLILVRKIKSASWGAVLLHHASISALLAVIAVVGWLNQARPEVWLAAACTGVILLQGLWSVALKSQGKGEASLLMDTGFWSVLALATLAAYIFAIPAVQRGVWSFTAMWLYFLPLIFWTIWRLIKAVPRNAIHLYFSTVHTGLPLMAVSLLALLATTSGRLGIGMLSSPEITAQYAVLFRATALPIVAHQIIIVARFRQIFELSIVELERRLPVIVGLVALSAIGFWLFSEVAAKLLGPAFVAAFSQHHTVGLLILMQCVLWSAIALNDLVNNRSQIAGQVARTSALYFVLVLPLAWWFLSKRPVTLALFVPVHSVVMAGYFLTQVATMYSCGIRLWRTWLLAMGSFVVLSVLTQIG